jgi:hypothetical protein
VPKPSSRSRFREPREVTASRHSAVDRVSNVGEGSRDACFERYRDSERKIATRGYVADLFGVTEMPLELEADGRTRAAGDHPGVRPPAA